MVDKSTEIGPPGPPYHLVSQSETTALTGSTTKMIGGSGGIQAGAENLYIQKKCGPY